MDRVEAYYLIVGSGSAGMAFCDGLLSRSDATLAIVDRHDAPDDHWHGAYATEALPEALCGLTHAWSQTTIYPMDT